ncbi:MAG: hypothetical protein V3575_01815 [Candidatus Absconditabacteria bacterium]
MIIHRKDKFFENSERRLSLEKDYGNGIRFYADIVILSEKFVEYQKDLFNEFFSQVIEKLGEENISIKDFQRFFEVHLQELNTKLNAFVSKIKDHEGKMEIRGFVQIFFNDSYISSMIGDVSIAIFRDNKLNYVMGNDMDDELPIDVFSEFIEGELEGSDTILCFGNNIFEVMDDNDLEDIPAVSNSEQKEIIIVTEEVLSSRITPKDIVFLIMSEVEQELVLNRAIKDKKLITDSMRLRIKDFFTTYKYPMLISICVLIILFMIYSLLSNWGKGNNGVTVVDDNLIYSDLTIEDVNKDIETFKRLDPSSDQKIQLYNEIKKKLDVLESKQKWTQDVQSLKKIVNEEYLKGFKIYPISPTDAFVSVQYEFQPTDLEALGDIKGLISNNGFTVGGDKGAIPGILTNSVRKDPIKLDVPVEIKGCSPNLSQNGLYCYTNDGKVFNVTKSGRESVTTRSPAFPNNIDGVGTFGTNRMYLLTSDPEYNSKGIFIIKYANLVGSQAKFGEGVTYSLKSDDITNQLPKLGSGFSSFAIDETFLKWSRDERALYQYKSDNQYLRTIKLEGGDNHGANYSDDVKVLAVKESRYVYLFDRVNQTFTAYRSAPYKDNSANATTYGLRYFFRIQLDFGESKIKDVYVENGKKPLLYVVGDKGIYQIAIYNFLTEN